MQVFIFVFGTGHETKKIDNFFQGLVGMNRNYWQGIAHFSVEEEKFQFYHPSP